MPGLLSYSGVYAGGRVASLYSRSPESTSRAGSRGPGLIRDERAPRTDCARERLCGTAYHGARAASASAGPRASEGAYSEVESVIGCSDGGALLYRSDLDAGG